LHRDTQVRDDRVPGVAGRAGAGSQGAAVFGEAGRLQVRVDAKARDASAAPAGGALPTVLDLSAAAVVAQVDVERGVEAEIGDRSVVAPVLLAVAVHVRARDAAGTEVELELDAGVDADAGQVGVLLPAALARRRRQVAMGAGDTQLGRHIDLGREAEREKGMLLVVRGAVTFMIGLNRVVNAPAGVPVRLLARASNVIAGVSGGAAVIVLLVLIVV
jgi:hypothetical protein